MNKTSIEWTDYTWNPVTGCDKVSAGCRSCYAETMATRFWGDRKFTDVQMHHDRLDEPFDIKEKLRGKKVFVNDVSDTFHDDVSSAFIIQMFEIMEELPDTIFQVLTKRVYRAHLLFRGFRIPNNVWIGTSCENQDTANERIPLLLQIPARVRFLSCEPLIGVIDFRSVPFSYPVSMKELKQDYLKWGDKKIDWVIAGGESGHQARPLHPDWARSLRDQCEAANVPFFFKQWGEWMPYNNMGLCSSQIAVLPKEITKNNFYQDETHELVSGSFQEWVKVGKSKSGNLLDGVKHLNFPKC